MERLKKIVGDKVYLSPINEEDLELFAKWHNDFEIADLIGLSDVVTSYSSQKKWYESGKFKYFFSIVNKENNNVIGYCDLYEVNFKDQIATLGILIGDKNNRNKGFGTESVKLLIEYAFNSLNINNIMLTVKSFNENAIHCYKKIGFVEIGRRHKCYYANGGKHDIIYMEILKEEYFNISCTNN